jgi:hypothetical protein
MELIQLIKDYFFKYKTFQLFAKVINYNINFQLKIIKVPCLKTWMWKTIDLIKIVRKCKRFKENTLTKAEKVSYWQIYRINPNRSLISRKTIDYALLCAIGHRMKYNALLGRS